MSGAVDHDFLVSAEALQCRKFELTKEICSNLKILRTLAWDVQNSINSYSKLIDGKILPVDEHLNKLFNNWTENLLLSEVIPNKENGNETNSFENRSIVYSVIQDDVDKEINFQTEKRTVKRETPLVKKSKKLIGWLFQKRRQLKSSKSSLNNIKKVHLAQVNGSDEKFVNKNELKNSSDTAVPNENIDGQLREVCKQSEQFSDDHQLLVDLGEQTINMTVDLVQTWANIIPATKRRTNAKTKKTKDECKVPCSVCKKMYHVKSVKLHMNFYHCSTERVDCPICIKSLRPWAFYRHFKRVHPTVDKIPCVACGTVCTVWRFLSDHTVLGHENL